LLGQVLWSNRLTTLAAGNQILVQADSSSVVTGYAPGESSSQPDQPDALLLKVNAAGANTLCHPFAAASARGISSIHRAVAAPKGESTPKVAATGRLAA